MRRVWLAVAVLALGCVATETGNPGFTHRFEPSSGNAVAPATVPPPPPMVSISGEPDSIAPPTGQVFAWNLENNLPPAIGPVNADGSFELQVGGLTTERIRLQVRAGAGERSLPVDVVVGDLGLAQTEPLPACLTVQPSFVISIEAGATGEITIENQCAETVTRSAARLRENLAGIQLEDDGKLELAPGEVSRLVIRVDGASSSIVEHVVFSIASPLEDIRAVTVEVP
ncbi:MAG: hypothetical protein AAGF12_08630 [Myxococcota bacterium]